MWGAKFARFWFLDITSLERCSTRKKSVATWWQYQRGLVKKMERRLESVVNDSRLWGMLAIRQDVATESRCVTWTLRGAAHR